MKLLIISPGKAHDATVADGIAEYQKRIKFDIEWAHPKASDIEAEGAAILKLIKAGDRVVLLDERGKDVDTKKFAEIVKLQIEGGAKRLVFIIGGAFGASERVKARADATLKLSSLTFPHMLARLILIEQLYRALSILEGGKYHHA